MNRRLAALASAVVATVMLAGCADTEPPAETQASVESTAPASVEESSTADEATTEAVVDVCAGTKGLEARSNNSQDRVGGYIQYEMVDRGPMPSANGEVIVDDEGNPSAYIVAEGDSPDAIAERLCTDPMYLEMLNSIRRNSNYSEEGTRFELFPGDTLNLNRFTIATVGDENGVVYDYTPRIHIPPQD